MNSVLEAILTVITPLIPVVIPGIAILAHPKIQTRSLLTAVPLVLTVSLTSHILGLFLTAWLGIPSLICGSLLFLITIYLLYRWRKQVNILFTWQALTFLMPLLLVYAFFAAPYLRHQDGLPTGDIQKTIFWASEITTTNYLPDYGRAIAHLNRDPVDFYTPGLHALAAYLITLSPQPLISLGLFAVVLGAAVGALAVSFTKLLFPQSSSLLYILTALFLFTNFRFLRYLREPGYHFQNLVGELLLFLFLFFGLQYLNRSQKNYRDLILTIFIGLALIISHQFSAFIAAFTAVPLLIMYIIQNRFTLRSLLLRPLVPIICAALILLGTVLAIKLDLHTKLPHIFTRNAHLLTLTPNLTDYPTLLGTIFLFLGLFGALNLLFTTLKKYNVSHTAFFLIFIVLLILSQGPRIWIDIPAVRALFYAVFPLSILAAYGSHRLWSLTTPLMKTSRYLLRLALLSVITISSYWSLQAAYATSDPTIRTNSTLTAPEVSLINHLAATNLNQGILVDDYNQRSASWLILSNKPTYSRLASDLERIMQEARQSTARYQLYLNHLDYEKIFAISSLPEISHLLQKHNLSHLTAIQTSNQDGFEHNPALLSSVGGDQVQLFIPNPTTPDTSCPLDSTCHWLLHTSTIANDIGDSEDTFAHLPASLRTTRLSAPLSAESTTYRETSAPLIPLLFNVGDYISILWDQDMNGFPDNTMEFLLTLKSPASSSLTVITPTNERYLVTPNEPLTLPTKDLPISPDGFITLTLENSEQRTLQIDLIAFGLARVP